MIRDSVVRKSDRQNLSVGLDDGGRRIIIRGGETCCHYAARAKRGIELTGCLGEKAVGRETDTAAGERQPEGGPDQFIYYCKNKFEAIVAIERSAARSYEDRRTRSRSDFH